MEYVEEMVVRMYSNISWADDVEKALLILGGQAHLSQIYEEVEKIRMAASRSVPRTLKQTIQDALERHSPESEKYTGIERFSLVEKGEGIYRLARLPYQVVSYDPIPPDEGKFNAKEEGEEGQLLIRRHCFRERDLDLVKSKKNSVLKETGKLCCEVCNFDFSTVYGERGRDFIECHHKKPLAELKHSQITRLDDLALVCSNCHRMIHRKPPWLSIEKLRQVVVSQIAKNT